MNSVDLFRYHIENHNFSKVMQLWEEYCSNDVIDPDELIEILKIIKKSPIAESFGSYAEVVIPSWKTIEDQDKSYKILQLIIDLQTTNSQMLHALACEALTKRYKNEENFNNFMRFVGLRSQMNFKGAITNFEMLRHLKVGNFVFHPGGWGAGEIMDVSHLREEVTIEFENVTGFKKFPFKHACKALTILPSDHFLARRFGNPDDLEKQAKDDPISVIHMMLRNLGPLTAADIKNELFELVIPKEDWTRWWQVARTKLKKDTKVSHPSSPKDHFYLREEEFSHEDRLKKEAQQAKQPEEIISLTYKTIRDFPQTFKKDEIKNLLKEKIFSYLKDSSLTESQLLQFAILLENHFSEKIEGKSFEELIKNLKNPPQAVNDISILAFKKRVIVGIRKYRDDWVNQYLDMILDIPQVNLCDYMLKELNQEETRSTLENKLQELVRHPNHHPETFVWFFQKAIHSKDLPFHDTQGQCQLLESFLILMHYLEGRKDQRDLLKKMYQIVTKNRYETIRKIIDGTPIEFINEFLVLISKCYSFEEHEQKIFRSLAEVVHPSLKKNAKEEEKDSGDILWTTEKGYEKTKNRIQQISEVEMVDCAKEIEIARSYGDLRENAEYKFAQERRARLQIEMQMLSKQLQRARLITENDIDTNKVGVGTVVTIQSGDKEPQTYTILGPFEADPEANILSYRSQLAKVMKGLKKGDTFEFKGQPFTIKQIKSYLAS